jgi:tetratricopeptide (TPR) repeat protein
LKDGDRALARYCAFISYSHHDEAFARRLHRRLEGYRLPRRLLFKRPDLAARLRPIFRDRDELAAAADLTEEVRTAIIESEYLIVICSSNAVQSAWVHHEVHLFRDIHGSHTILAALVSGATPEVIREVLDGGDAIGQIEPLAADFGRDGVGARLALLKLIAVLAGVRLDELVQRDAQRRVRNSIIIGSSALIGMCIMVVLTVALLQAEMTTKHQQARSATLIEYMLTDMRARLKSVGRLDLLDAINKGATAYYASQTLSDLSDDALMQRAELLEAVGADNEKRGNLFEARSSFQEAKRTTDALLRAGEGDQKRIFAASQSEYYVGLISWRLGRMDEADSRFRAYLRLTKRLVQMDPDNASWLMEKGDASANLGMFYTRRSLDLDHAEPLFLETLADFRQVAVARPQDTEVQLQVADAYGWLGDLERLRGNCDAAYMYRQKAKTIIAGFLVTDRENAELRTSMVSNNLAIARVDLCRKDFDRAVKELQAGEIEAARVAQIDRSDLGAQQQVRIFSLFTIRAIILQSYQIGASASLIPSVGNCEADGIVLHSEELQNFCRILDCQTAILRRDRAAAKRALNGVNFASLLRQGRLSERWGLNFQDEAACAATP